MLSGDTRSNMTIKVLYITSLSHSGSTLLDLLLNGHSRIFSVGEIKQLPTKWKNLKRNLSLRAMPFKCSCGQDLRDCDFWKTVNTQSELLIGKSLSELNMKGFTDDAFMRDNEAIFEILSDVSKTNFILRLIKGCKATCASEEGAGY